MLIAIDFDGTIVDEGREFSDVTSPLQLRPGAREALVALKQAGHILVIVSSRANQALLTNPILDPLVRCGVSEVDMEHWLAAQPLHQARFDQMQEFVGRELTGLIDAVDDGMQGKIVADLYLDNRGLKVGAGLASRDWMQIADEYGEP